MEAVYFTGCIDFIIEMFSTVLSTLTALKVHKDKICVSRKVQHVYTQHVYML